MEKYQQKQTKWADKTYFPHENGVTEIDLEYEAKGPTRKEEPIKTKSSRLIIIAFETEK